MTIRTHLQVVKRQINRFEQSYITRLGFQILAKPRQQMMTYIQYYRKTIWGKTVNNYKSVVKLIYKKKKTLKVISIN